MLFRSKGNNGQSKRVRPHDEKGLRTLDKSILYQYEENKENIDPNTIAREKTLAMVVNREREAVSNMKNEVQRVYSESREERKKFKNEIEELKKENSEYYKELSKARNNICEMRKQIEKIDSILNNVKKFVDCIVENLLQINCSNNLSESNLLTNIKDSIVAEIENFKIGIDFSEDIMKLKSKVNISTISGKSQIWAVPKLEKIQEEILETADNNHIKPKNRRSENHRKVNHDDFIIERKEYCSALTTLKGPNGVINTKDNSIGTIGASKKIKNKSSSYLLNKEYTSTTNAMKQLEDIKTMIMNRRKRINDN